MIEWNSEERERYSNVEKYAYPNVVTFSQICSMMSQRLIDVFFRFLSLSHFQDKLLPPRIERESDESDEDESPKASPLRFQHRTTSPNSTEEENNRHHRNHRNHRDRHNHRSHRNHRNRRNRRDDSNDLEDLDDPNNLNEDGNEDLPGEVIAIPGEDDTPFSEQEERRRQQRLTMGQTLERGLYGFSLLLKRWLRVIGHFACRRGIGR